MSAKPQIATLTLEAGAIETSPAFDLAGDRLAAGAPVRLRFHPATEIVAEAIGRARAALAGLRLALIRRHGLPRDAYVEVDDESHGVPVAPFHRRRFLLPHQDGGHCSFLTPSRLDCPDIRPEDRTFSASVYWRRPSHKLFQGFLVTEPGDPAGRTYYYDAVALLGDAFRHQIGRKHAQVAELAGFALENLRRAKAVQPRHGSRYLTPGAFLGSPNPAHHVLPSGPRAESEFWAGQYANLPELLVLSEACPCGGCHGPGDRLLCHALTATLGQTWPQVRSRYEAATVADRHDLLVANNLTLFHAAESPTERTIVPMCIVLDRPAGIAYERWLAAQWRCGADATNPTLATT